MMQYQIIVLSERTVLFYTARDRESLGLWCTTSKAWCILACVIHHFLFIGWLFSKRVTSEFESSARLGGLALAVSADHIPLSFSLRVGDWRQR